ncbi:MAG: ribonuclease D, partial [Rhodospirillales bacterium]|nr:ribonuclease D [Rhodospirillales bacterium]
MTIHLHQGDLPKGIDFGASVAIDTETQGLNLHRDRLCVIQFSAGDGDAHIVQVPVGGVYAPNIKALLEEREVVKIFHFARFDVAVLLKHTEAEVRSVYCTKIASKLVRT